MDKDESEYYENFPLTRYIWVSGDGISHPYLGMGMDSVFKLYKLAEENKIKNAEEVNISYIANCDITFTGENFLKFLQEFFPDDYKYYKNDVKSDSVYKVSAIDFS